MPKLPSLLFAMVPLAIACGEPDDGMAADTGADSMNPADGSTSGVDESGSGTSDDPTGEPAQDVPARGVTVSLVEANTGVAIPIGANGEWVGPEGRNAPLPKDRNTAIRVYVDVDESVWVQRDIEARLLIELPDGTVETFSEVETIAMDSSTTSLQSGFLFGVLAEYMVPGVKYQVQLYEAGGDYASLPEAAEPPATPAEPDFIGVEGTELQMKVVIVPVQYSGPGCNSTVDTSEETRQRYEDAMYQQNPVVSLDLSWGETYVVDDLDLGSESGFYTLLDRAVQLRASNAPPPNVYYYVLFDNCGACIGDSSGCTLGVAPGIPDDSMGSATYRVAIGTQYLSGSEVGVDTFVHEIGHTQGRAHVACPGVQSAGPDPTYPHEGGSIGVWGFGVRDFGVRNPSNHTDYMSYCSPTWVSDWQWKATYDRIRVLTSWDAANVGLPEDEAVLVGMINPETGESSWFTERGFVSESADRPDDHQLRFLAGDAELDATRVQVDHWTEGPGITVRAPLPATWAEVTAIEYAAPDHQYAASREAIRQYHRPDALAQP